MPELHYEPTTAGRPVAVEQDGDVTRIVVAMQGVYAPVPAWVCELDMLSVVVYPAAVVVSLIVRPVLRLPKPPRAVFEITADEFSLTETCRTTGRRTTFTLPRAAIAEARANRYEAGLWIDVPGNVKTSLLTDVPRQTIERIDAALRGALGA